MDITNILRSVFDAEAKPINYAALTSEQWRKIYTFSAEQGILAIVWDVLQQTAKRDSSTLANMPRELKIRWALNVEQIEQKYARQKAVIEKLSVFLAQHDIKMMVVKGYGLSLCFPRADHRPCGDIDIWFFTEHTEDGRTVRKSAQQKADELLREHFKIRINEDEHHHTVFYVDGVMIENHYDFINIHAHRSNRIIEQKLKSLAQAKLESVQVGDGVVYFPSPDFHSLFLLRHSAAHFAAEKIGIRHLLDWRYYVEVYNDRIDWTWLEEFAREMNMHRFLYAMNAICVDYLGLPQSKAPSFDRDKQLEDRVLGEILSPEFSDEKPQNAGYISSWIFMFNRWWTNRWKHKIVYRESLLATFVVQVWSHLLKPKSLKVK